MDSQRVRAWWGRWPSANIGAKVPDALIVFDVDPRNGGLESWDRLIADHDVPDTLTLVSGRGDGGSHRYFLRPDGPISGARVPKGIDLKRNGYMIMPPSLHPVTGLPYRVHDVDPVPLPLWLREVLRPAPPKAPLPFSRHTDKNGRTLVDFVANQVEGDGHRNDALYWATHRAIEDGVLDQIQADLVAVLWQPASLNAAELTVASARTNARRSPHPRPTCISSHRPPLTTLTRSSQGIPGSLMPRCKDCPVAW